MCARFTVLSDTPIASAIAGCVIPLSRSSTIWMRWRRLGRPFHRSAVFNRRTWPLEHLTICSLRIRWPSESHPVIRKQFTFRSSVAHHRKPIDSISYGSGIRFEDLILDTEVTLSRICNFIEIDFVATMLNYHERAPKRLQEHQGRNFADGLVLSKTSRFNQQIRATLVLLQPLW